MSKIFFVNLGDLSLPSFQAHRETSQEHIKEISDSIKLIGVIEPLIVRRTDKGLEIVAGCVRYRAALLAGLKAVPCIILNLDLKESEILKLHENVKRIPLDHVDQGHTFIMMMKTFNMTEKEISESVGKSIPYISQHISLVRLGNELTKAVKDKLISFSQARELMRVDDPVERNRLLRYCQEDGATVQVLQRWVQEHLRDISKSPPSEQVVHTSRSDLEDIHVSRPCEACDKLTEISKIYSLLLCKHCHDTIKQAIFDEKKAVPSESPEKASQDAPG